MSFSIVNTPIQTRLPSDDTSGGLVTFVGLVRNHNEGKSVCALEYTCYEQMALKEGDKIVAKAKELFGVTDALCIHRMGHLEIGQVAVYVYAHSPHRKEAFLACEYIIDEVKKTVPIWKKEHYLDQDPEWVACHRCAHTESKGL